MLGAAQVIRESTGPTERTPERAVARLWRNAHVLAEGLEAEDGRRFRVVYPGRPSGLAGPDFRDSLIETDTGELLFGDVELHVDAPDWYGHGHDRDPSYSGVVLHVVLHPKGARSSLQHSGTRAPVVSLGPATRLLGGGEAPAVDVLSWLSASREPGLGQVLDRAGDQRFLAKARGYAMELGGCDPEEALYRGLMEGLGYAANRKPFRRLAEAVPFSMLRALRGEPRVTRLLAIEAMLMGAAGLVCRVEPTEKRPQMLALLKRLPKTRKVNPQDWRMSRVRPGNHPARRVFGAARLVDAHVESGLVRGLAEAIGRPSASVLVRRLSATPHIGAGRARELAVNVALPFTYAWAGTRRDRALQESALALYRGFPKLGDNEVTREMKRLLAAGEEAVEVDGARRQQGMLHLYKALRERVRGRSRGPGLGVGEQAGSQ